MEEEDKYYVTLEEVEEERRCSKESIVPVCVLIFYLLLAYAYYLLRTRVLDVRAEDSHLDTTVFPCSLLDVEWAISICKNYRIEDAKSGYAYMDFSDIQYSCVHGPARRSPYVFSVLSDMSD